MSHEMTGGVVTILQSKNKTLRPMKVAQTKIVTLTSTNYERERQESGQTEKEDRKR